MYTLDLKKFNSLPSCVGQFECLPCGKVLKACGLLEKGWAPELTEQGHKNFGILWSSLLKAYAKIKEAPKTPQKSVKLVADGEYCLLVDKPRFHTVDERTFDFKEADRMALEAAAATGLIKIKRK